MERRRAVRVDRIRRGLRPEEDRRRRRVAVPNRQRERSAPARRVRPFGSRLPGARARWSFIFVKIIRRILYRLE